MPRSKTACDENRPTAEFDRFEFRNGRLIVGCKCTRNDGMQHECERLRCMADRPLCLARPSPACLPSRPCPPRPRAVRRDDGQHDRNRAKSPPPPPPSPPPPRRAGGVVDGAGGSGGGSVGGRWGGAERNARCRPFNERRMRKWAADQYDDRPALRKFFRPCRVHCVKKKTNDRRRPREDVKDTSK